mmetsp:Transcript_818/g.2479  ORF Transcript_818/g.2479 Transcript_818/m.2479 type:complete len:95 (-) Transcript_818:396-680(-)
MAILRERAVALLCGAGCAGVACISTERLIWRSTDEVASVLPGAPPPPAAETAEERLLGAYARACMVRSWNQAVDAVFGAAVESLCIKPGSSTGS